MAKAPDVVTVDFETKAIGPYPDYPPKPVGVSVLWPGDTKANYYAFGHPLDNNCDERMARVALATAYKSGKPLLFHNAKFDMDVAEKHWDLPVPLDWQGFHDTMFLLFLDNPYEDLGLKPSAARLLNMAPEEQDALREWLIANKIVPKNAKKIGHLICECPGTLVGKYANGDVIRTCKLFNKLYPAIVKRGMLDAYNRERQLLPILLRNEHEGIRVDVPLMEQDWAQSKKDFKTLDDWLHKCLKTTSLNLDSNNELADALIKAGKADESKFLLTPKGERSVDKESLSSAVTDKKILQALQHRSKLATAAGTFLGPWLTEALANKGYVHPQWNQVRQPGKAKFSDGARTGRLTASRFMNVPKEFEESDDGYQKPSFTAVHDLPNVRMYMLPDKGQLWNKRDYSQQELRVLAHFEDGILLEEYLRNPYMDVHTYAASLVTDLLGIIVEDEKDFKRWRSRMKTIGFGLLYGMGLGALATRMEVDIKTAQQIKAAYLNVFPGLKALQSELKTRGASGLAIKTWGGREYLVEPPKYIESRGRVCTFEYKLFNYLIQGSSADCTKEAIIRYDDMRQEGRFLCTVHDEISMSCPKRACAKEMAILKEVMASIEFDVPMLSEGSRGERWGLLQKRED